MIDILNALCNIFLKMNPLTTVEAAAFFELAQNPTVNNFARLNQFLFGNDQFSSIMRTHPTLVHLSPLTQTRVLGCHSFLFSRLHYFIVATTFNGKITYNVSKFLKPVPDGLFAHGLLFTKIVKTFTHILFLKFNTWILIYEICFTYSHMLWRQTQLPIDWKFIVSSSRLQTVELMIGGQPTIRQRRI